MKYIAQTTLLFCFAIHATNNNESDLWIEVEQPITQANQVGIIHVNAGSASVEAGITRINFYDLPGCNTFQGGTTYTAGSTYTFTKNKYYRLNGTTLYGFGYATTGTESIGIWPKKATTWTGFNSFTEGTICLAVDCSSGTSLMGTGTTTATAN